MGHPIEGKPPSLTEYYLFHDPVEFVKMSVSAGLHLPPHVKILSSSMTTKQNSRFSIGMSGKDPNVSPSEVVKTLESRTVDDPPAITRPQDSELPYPLYALSSDSVPELIHSSSTGSYLKQSS